MRSRKLSMSVVLLAVAASAVPGQSFTEMLKRELPMGALREGQVVLVDDGSCPAGEVKQVTGGNHVLAGGYKNIVRTRKCIPR